MRRTIDLGVDLTVRAIASYGERSEGERPGVCH